jgi:hypothetical protein
VPGQNVCICATAIERTSKVVRTLRRAGGRCFGGERRTNSSVGRASTRTTTQQCNYQDAKAASCMRLMHADGDMQRGSTNFCGDCRPSALPLPLPLPRRSASVAVASVALAVAAKLNRHSVCSERPVGMEVSAVGCRVPKGFVQPWRRSRDGIRTVCLRSGLARSGTARRRHGRDDDGFISPTSTIPGRLSSATSIGRKARRFATPSN